MFNVLWLFLKNHIVVSVGFVQNFVDIKNAALPDGGNSVDVNNHSGNRIDIHFTAELLELFHLHIEKLAAAVTGAPVFNPFLDSAAGPAVIGAVFNNQHGLRTYDLSVIFCFL